MSYGHDAFEELAIGLDSDLPARGHDVWFDKHELLLGVQELKVQMAECDLVLKQPKSSISLKSRFPSKR